MKHIVSPTKKSLLVLQFEGNLESGSFLDLLKQAILQREGTMAKAYVWAFVDFAHLQVGTHKKPCSDERHKHGGA